MSEIMPSLRLYPQRQPIHLVVNKRVEILARAKQRLKKYRMMVFFLCR